MEFLKLVKQVGGVLITVGIFSIVGNVVKATTPEATKGLAKICISVGGFALSTMLAANVVGHSVIEVDRTVDEIKKDLEELEEKEKKKND